MVQINFAQKAVNVKIVFYGPGMSGKTTNLEVVHQRAPDTNRGELTSISTDGDRTLFFDYMPLELGTVAGMRTCFQLYTVPGQVYYNSTRKLVLQGVDGVIFIADSSAAMLDQNLESLRNLEENLNEYGKSLATMPHVLQWNKRDLPDAMSPEELDRLLNTHGCPAFEAIANTGQGVFPTLKALAALVLKTIRQESSAPHSAGAAPVASAAPGPAVQAPGFAGAPVPQAQQAHQAPPGPPAQPGGMPAPQAFPAGAPPAAAASAQPGPGFGASPVQDPGAFAQQPAASTMPPAQASAGHATAPSRPRSATAGEVMRATPSAAQKARKRPAPAAAARQSARVQAAARQQQLSTPPRKGGSFLTATFVVLAAGAGIGLAWFILNSLQ